MLIHIRCHKRAGESHVGSGHFCEKDFHVVHHVASFFASLSKHLMWTSKTDVRPIDIQQHGLVDAETAGESVQQFGTKFCGLNSH